MKRVATKISGQKHVDRSEEWWHEFYPLFHPLFGLIPQRTTQAEVRHFIKKLGLKKGMSFLDCPCGIGRVSIPMAELGIRVTGVDIVPSFLDELREKAGKKNLTIPTYHNDMRRVNFKNEFDAAGNLWTSFGFFSDADNLLVIKKMYQALKPGGKFLLHVINRDWLLRHYQPNDWHETGDIRSLESRKFDFETSINRSVFTQIRDGEERQVRSDIRMYSYHELHAMFRKVGFVDIEGYGTMKSEPINLDSRMIFILGTKPKRS
jgi:SAM-dependent methyltransferase